MSETAGWDIDVLMSTATIQTSFDTYFGLVSAFGDLPDEALDKMEEAAKKRALADFVPWIEQVVSLNYAGGPSKPPKAVRHFGHREAKWRASYGLSAARMSSGPIPSGGVGWIAYATVGRYTDFIHHGVLTCDCREGLSIYESKF